MKKSFIIILVYIGVMLVSACSSGKKCPAYTSNNQVEVTCDNS
ncbi:MAG: hypothetical protein ACOCWG_01865 [bacterium]